MNASDPTVAEMLERSALADRVQADVSLAPFCTYRVGGRAAHFIQLDTIDELVELAVISHHSGVATLVIGKGSNLLVADRGFDGIAFTLGSAFADVEIEDRPDRKNALVRVGAAAALPVVARATVAAGLTGFAWAVGVPGSIGGALRMNAGGHGSNMAASLQAATVVDMLDGTATAWSVDDFAYSYRHSALQSHHVVVDATLALEYGDRETGEASLSEIVRWRREHQPGGQNAGSVFTNPEGDSAGRLIDTAGGRGLRIGTAEVSVKHANFIQADPNGSADDVFELMQAVRRLVLEHHGVDLVPETRLIGFDL